MYKTGSEPTMVLQTQFASPCANSSIHTQNNQNILPQPFCQILCTSPAHLQHLGHFILATVAVLLLRAHFSALGPLPWWSFCLEHSSTTACFLTSFKSLLRILVRPFLILPITLSPSPCHALLFFKAFTLSTSTLCIYLLILCPLYWNMSSMGICLPYHYFDPNTQNST